MPMDITVKLKDGTTKYYYIPLRIMRGEKGADIFEGEVQPDWPWTNPEYNLEVDIPADKIESIHIDESTRFSDVNYSNNVWPVVEEEK